MAPPTRPVQFKMMLSEEERDALQALADAEGLTASDYLRQFIRRETAAKKATKKR